METIEDSVDEASAKAELGKYLSLRIEGAPMFSAYIDHVWHRLAESRGEYDAFCRETWGEPVVHSPHAPGDPVFYRIPWVADYEAKFGKLPLVWFANADGSIDRDLLDRYRKSGVVERMPPMTEAFLTCDCKPAKGGAA